MVDVLPATSDCLHVGWALWRDHWQWRIRKVAKPKCPCGIPAGEKGEHDVTCLAYRGKQGG